MEGAVAERPGNTLSYTEKVEILKALEEAERRKNYAGHLRFFPDEGPYAYHQYKKHMEFLRLGATKRERMFMAGNRVGKSIAGGYEMACHLTGIYPHWWEGRRFLFATDCWAAGDTGQTTRDIVQATLLGENNDWGTGLIPGDCLDEIRMRPGGGGAVDLVRVKHSSGQYSKLGFKSYDQKRRAFQGTAKHCIWLDEEPPIDVYGECLMRTMTTNGVVYVTFTPLMGITKFVQEFLDATESARDRASE
jgi:phage terminase large subunit-like protein